MYQNLQQLQNSPYYQYPYNQQYQRLAQLEQQQQMNTPYNTMVSQNQSFLKGRPVVSMEEARAAQIDLDGSLFIFTDIGNKKIYTKQINLDGTATLNTYSLVENVAPIESYVTKTEFEKAISSIREEMVKKETLERNVDNDSIKQQQSGTTKKAVCKPSSF
ncbi:hypothetical protein [Megamonas funiformis]|jgi:hypothetical protein|uniref:hypothetical protein n=1 Tax=Megamonas funiformis TaxID=437897 RepID=UPI003F843D1F